MITALDPWSDFQLYGDSGFGSSKMRNQNTSNCYSIWDGADSLTGGGNLSLDMETDLPVGVQPLPFIPEASLSMPIMGLIAGLLCVRKRLIPHTRNGTTVIIGYCDSWGMEKASQYLKSLQYFWINSCI